MKLKIFGKHTPKEKENQEEDCVTYLPVYRYKGDRSNVVSGMYSAAVELARNSFGKKENIQLEKKNGYHHLEGRGDTHHRVGGVLSEEEHDHFIAQSDKLRSRNLANRKKVRDC